MTKHTRELTEFETTVSKALAEKTDFIYYPHDKGSGYWFSKSAGIQLTHDLIFNSRGASCKWVFAWWDTEEKDLKKVFFTIKKRRYDRIAEAITKKAIEAVTNTEEFKKRGY